MDVLVSTPLIISFYRFLSWCLRFVRLTYILLVLNRKYYIINIYLLYGLLIMLCELGIISINLDKCIWKIFQLYKILLLSFKYSGGCEHDSNLENIQLIMISHITASTPFTSLDVVFSCTLFPCRYWIILSLISHFLILAIVVSLTELQWPSPTLTLRTVSTSQKFIKKKGRKGMRHKSRKIM